MYHNFYYILALLLVDAAIAKDEIIIESIEFPQTNQTTYMLTSNTTNTQLTELAMGPPNITIAAKNASASFFVALAYNLTVVSVEPSGPAGEEVSTYFPWIQGNLTATNPLGLETNGGLVSGLKLVPGHDIWLQQMYEAPRFGNPIANFTFQVWEETPALLAFLPDMNSSEARNIYVSYVYSLLLQHDRYPKQPHLPKDVPHGTLNFQVTNITGDSEGPIPTVTVDSMTASPSSVTPSTSSMSSGSSVAPVPQSTPSTSSQNNSGSSLNMYNVVGRLDMILVSLASGLACLVIVNFLPV